MAKEWIVPDADLGCDGAYFDYQELVRCGECVHRYVAGDNVRFNVCELNHNKVQSDEWFCADGERRTDEAD